MSNTLPKAKSASPSQKFIDIQEIRDDVVVLKNGGLRAVCIASSINFELKSSDEQKALIGNFQGFLNSLDFPVQIVVSSRKMDISSYLNDLRELAKTQENELLQAQTIEYIEFIEKFVELTNIMSKNFYLVIPFNPMGFKKEGFLDRIKYIIKPKEVIQKISPEKFQEYKDQLMQRVNHVIIGLRTMEIRARILNTDQLIRLFYDYYNPEE